MVLRQSNSKSIVEQNGEQDQAKISRVPPAIKEQRCTHQPGNGDTMMASHPDGEIAEQSNREKNYDEDVGVEKQCWSQSGNRVLSGSGRHWGQQLTGF